MENKNFNTFIKGEIVDLIPSSAEYVHLYCKWMSDHKVRHFFRGPFPVIFEDMKYRFENPPDIKLRDYFSFTIIHKKDQKPIGACGLNRINWVNQWSNSFIYIGEVKYWGNDIATDAVRLILQYGFEELNLHKISGTVSVENVGSWKVAEKVGFTFEGIIKADIYKEGKYIDVKKYGFLKEDWERIYREENEYHIQS
ncbi:MAG: GNAT family N-acetyltransferase [Candidatus Heimdallarchaeota archaeon]